MLQEEPRHPDGSVVDIVDRNRKPEIKVIEVEEDVCFTCGVEAFVYAKLASGRTVAYCGHHGTEYWDALNAQATVIDLRFLIGATFEDEQ